MILLIGYGSTLRGDDGVGQHIANRLDVSLYLDTVEVIACHQLRPELVEAVSRADHVLFVDAAQDGQAGDIRCCSIEPEIPTGAFTHSMTPAGLLAAANHLYGVHPQGTQITITGAQFDYGENLSPEVEAAVPKVLEQIHTIIEADTLQQIESKAKTEHDAKS
jgi:hydrogenase maturation protease